MPANPHTLKIRRLAASLVSCPGWTDWVLPKLRQIIEKARETVLNNESLSPEEVMQQRKIYRAFTRDFLDALRLEAEAAFDTSAPVMHTDELDSTLPESSVIEATLKALSLDPNAPARPTPPPPAPPTEPLNDISPFALFSGQPSSARAPKPQKPQPPSS